MKVIEKISALRDLMRKEGIDACIIPSSDPHIGEYIPNHWESRKWISGFGGSAGVVAFTLKEAGLWTDSRYFLQAGNELQDSTIRLFKEGLPETPSIKDWLSRELAPNACIAIDGNVYAASEALLLKSFFEDKTLRFRTDFNPFDLIWKDRPEIPSNKIFLLPEEVTGASARSKITNLLQEINYLGADSTVLASLDAVAWLFNIRGKDVEFNPVALSYAYVSEKETVLFIDSQKLTVETGNYLKSQQIIVADYDKVFDYISKRPASEKILVNPVKINYALYDTIQRNCIIKETTTHPVDLLKSVKNQTEINGFRNALTRDGVALTKFFIRLEKSLAAGEIITEIDICRQLSQYRSEQDYYFGDSFSHIVGYGPNGAIVHYHPTKENCAVVEPKGLLLIDSGAQYLDGTTDITRTIAVGALSEQMRTDYTLVLKGHIRLALARFPQGTKGVQLDILARKALWDRGLNYLHGTGHGVGHFLNVHEGPQSIRMDLHPTALQPGMICSNEPGLYRTGEYGIRTENLILTIEREKTPFGAFFQFETLTLFPIDKTPIDKSLLSSEEIDWLNEYHRQVFEKLSPFLNEEEKVWLKGKTEKL